MQGQVIASLPHLIGISLLYTALASQVTRDEKPTATIVVLNTSDAAYFLPVIWLGRIRNLYSCAMQCSRLKTVPLPAHSTRTTEKECARTKIVKVASPTNGAGP